MYKFMIPVRSAAAAATVVLLSSVFFLSCKKETNANADIPVAALMAFNLSPDRSAVGFTLSGNNLTNAPLSYSAYTGTYLRVYPGQRSVVAYDNYYPSGTLAATEGNFVADNYYSVFLVGADSSYRNIVVNDKLDTLSAVSGKAFIRYVNAIPDSVSVPVVTATSSGNNIMNNPVSFASVSEFVPVNAGDITIAVKNNNGIDVSRTITVGEKKVYTILLVGVPGSGTTPVEIKYIINGMLEDKVTTAAVSADHVIIGN